MSDSLRDVFQIPKNIRDRMIAGSRDAKAFLDNAALLKQLGLMNEKDEGDMKTLVEMAQRLEKITSAAPAEIEKKE